MLIIRSNCINTASDIVFSVSDGRSLTVNAISHAVLIQFDLMMSTELVETCRGS